LPDGGATRVLPAHLVHEWHGHTDAVALEHYALVTDQDSSMAPATTTPGVWLGQQKSDVKSDVRASKKTQNFFAGCRKRRKD